MIARWLPALLVSLGVHAALAGGWLAYRYASGFAEAAPEQFADPGPRFIVGELVARAAPALPAEQGTATTTAAPPPDVASTLASGGRDGYFARLRDHLAAYRRPDGAPTIGIARVRFRIGADGQVEEVLLVDSSGSAALDAEALALVARASPVPAPPQGREMTVLVPVEFR